MIPGTSQHLFYRTAFRACAFNHSAISPFRIKSLTGT